MRSAVALGRLCLRQTGYRPQPAIFRHIQAASRRTYRSAGRQFFRQPPSRGLIWAAAGLTPAAFVYLSEKDNEGTEQTAEGRMLEASREEIQKKLSDDDRGISRLGNGIILFLDLYIWEPICTGVRFLHLVFIFVPVIASVPALWIGTRDKTRDNERSGTLWWYKFLVKSMERAGPAFIKVRSSGCVEKRR
jgi:aarF domain-containing kinase